MLKNRQDLKSIAFVVISIFLTTSGLFIHTTNFQAAIWFLAQFVFCYCCCVINHNHTHASTFTSRRANEIFSDLLTIAKGHTSTQVVVPHNLNHHVYPGKKEDWSRPDLASGEFGWLRLPTYLFKASREMTRKRKLPEAPSLSLRAKKKVKREMWILYCYAFFCLLINWHHSLFFIFPIWILAMLTLLSANLIQHDGCDPESEWEHSRNFSGKWGNWMMFNNGYHTIHHLKPTLHWSLLKKEHEKWVEPHLQNKWVENSIPKFVLKKYLFKRVKFQSPAPASQS